VLIAALVWRGIAGGAEIVGGVGALLLVLGLTPAAAEMAERGLVADGARAGAVNARILLTILFAIVLVPLATVWRFTGKDPLSRRRSTWPGWVPYPARYRDTHHYSRMY
jgi:hypothetical protein